MSIPVEVDYADKGDPYGGSQAALDARSVYPHKTTKSLEDNIEALTNAVHKTPVTGANINGYVLSHVPFNDNTNNLDIYFNGVLAEEGAGLDYTVDTSTWTITWLDTGSLEDDDRIIIKIYGHEPVT